MGMPSLRGLTIDVLGGAEAVGHGLVVAVREISPTLVDEVVDSVERVPALVRRLGGALAGVETLLPGFDSVRTRAAAEVELVDDTRRRADAVVTDTDELLQRANRLLGAGESLLARAGDLLTDVEGSTRRLLPLVRAVAETADEQLVEVLLDSVRRWPTLFGQVSDDMVPALAAMQSAVPDVSALRELITRLEPLMTEVSHTVSGLPGARRALKRGARDHDGDSGGSIGGTGGGLETGQSGEN
jgi:uncharacterized protein YoxC